MIEEYTSILETEVADYIKDVQSGVKHGLATGFEDLDRNVGRPDSGHLWVIGGYAGVGKSYFILNLVNNMRKLNKGIRVAIFTTELTPKGYALRHILMEAGVYRLQYEDQPQQYKADVDKAFIEYIQHQKTYGDIYIQSVKTGEEIEKAIKLIKPDIVFVDYVQQLTYQKFRTNEDSMPSLAMMFQNLPKTYKIPVIVASQLNNYAVNSDADKETLAPFQNGRDLNQAAQVSIVLKREKEESILMPILEVRVIKARDGETCKLLCEIEKGYKLRKISAMEGDDIRRRKRLENRPWVNTYIKPIDNEADN
jgi:replicative DNA helicase